MLMPLIQYKADIACRFCWASNTQGFLHPQFHDMDLRKCRPLTVGNFHVKVDTLQTGVVHPVRITHGDGGV